ncbi:MAG: Histidine-tRNA ligase 1 [Candidatus Giovannonibacteria bacterium GW2011_GWA2_53_7]|uniref:Histidyl-tRNA synthetase n=1 Tax=Candidatus Giovannonibacteria bacterium GW2011_GWA2_53_7 TaxID=1618650 RepID=A0A0G1XUN8_9BACT|nr:MAG: Histidine-tRNA ligase 1 [Candidatus Giovannonibacteria bacterium GW2011_GWA2_53_7]
MIRIKGTPYQNTAAFLSAASHIAEYYGFEHFDRLPREPQRRTLPPGARPDADINFARRDEKHLPSAARRIAAAGMPPQGATLAWRTLPLPSGASGVSLELHAVGIDSAIAEALLIITADAILKHANISERILSINNIGSAESSGRYVRDVGGYLRKHIESISASLRPRVAVDPLGALVQLIERGHPAVSRAPQAMEYLTEDERRRFWDLLEYLEISGLPYELNGQILGSRDCWAHTLYEIGAVDPETGARATVAFGGRYDPLMSRFARKPYAATMIAIHAEARGATSVKVRTPGVRAMYFAHLGLEARRRILPALERLREAGIPIYHGLWNERIGEQMTAARALATPYILIMGHKEAIEGNVLVREVATNSQEAVSLEDLPSYLKQRRLGISQTADK